MSDIAINIENLSKQYKIGITDKGRTFRESLTDKIVTPLREIRNIFAHNTSVVDTGSESIWALKYISLQVKQVEVLGVIGRNGIGKTTLLKMLSRITEPTEGEARITGRVGLLLKVWSRFSFGTYGHRDYLLKRCNPGNEKG